MSPQLLHSVSRSSLSSTQSQSQSQSQLNPLSESYPSSHSNGPQHSSSPVSSHRSYSYQYPAATATTTPATTVAMATTGSSPLQERRYNQAGLGPASSPSSSSSLSSPSPSPSLQSSPSPSPSSYQRSAASSRFDLEYADEENATITASRFMSKKLGKQRSQEDLRLLAISTNITELSYVISDIQTRIFEIQELRHKSHSSGDAASTTSIDQALINLDERLDSVDKGIKAIDEAIEPILRNAPTPTAASTLFEALSLSESPESSSPPSSSSNSTAASSSSSSASTAAAEHGAILRKYEALVVEWKSVQDESGVLREELKEDKWLTVFRTVTDQADGMMSSLEKAVNRCQDFIYQVHRRGPDENSPTHRSGDRPLITYEVFISLLESYEAKKKHYMPATSKVLSIIDKGVRDRVTKNGETLRRHAESAQRWKSLRDRINRTDSEMENVRKIILSGELSPSENGSSTSMSTKNGYLATPPNGTGGGGRMSRAASTSNTISRSISPLRKIARKLTGGGRPSTTNSTPYVTPLAVNKHGGSNRTPTSEPPPQRSVRNSFFGTIRAQVVVAPATPERSGHKYSQSLTPDTSPHVGNVEDLKSTSATAPIQARPQLKQQWNSSTKVEAPPHPGSIRGGQQPPRRAPSATGNYSTYDEPGSISYGGGTPYRRSLSRASVTSGRPYSPSVSTAGGGYHYHPSLPQTSSTRPSSRAAQSQTRQLSLSLSNIPPPTTPAPLPRARPKTPSQIPGPSRGGLRSISGNQSEGGWTNDDDDHVLRNGAFSPTFSASGASSAHPPRPPSRSMIPVPSVHLSSASRPSSSLSNYGNYGGYNQQSPSVSASGGGGAYGRSFSQHHQHPPVPSTPDSPSHNLSFRNSVARTQGQGQGQGQQSDAFRTLSRTQSASAASATSSAAGGRKNANGAPPPSSFKDGPGGGGGGGSAGGNAGANGSGGNANGGADRGSNNTSSRGPSRPSSRSGAYTPSSGGGGYYQNNFNYNYYNSANTTSSSGGSGGYGHGNNNNYNNNSHHNQNGFAEYVVGNPKDPLDVEIALIFNSLRPLGLSIERVDPFVRGGGGGAKDEEIKAQYAFISLVTHGRKVVTCRLSTLTRAGKAGMDVTTKKVMCRVGGGWQDLSHYILNRQAGGM